MVVGYTCMLYNSRMVVKYIISTLSEIDNKQSMHLSQTKISSIILLFLTVYIIALLVLVNKIITRAMGFKTG